jgi:putative RNA 2'-phosphotransferase
MSRHYVHLAVSPEMAAQVGWRRDRHPAILRIRAAEAHAAGVIFGTPSGGPDNVYLVVALPPQFIEFPDEGK